MKELIESVEKLIPEELVRANEEFGSEFNSMHEGYAVIKEEIEEAQAELVNVIDDLDEIWDFIKSNNNEDALEIAKSLKQSAILLACESIQIAAMAEKYIRSFKEGE
jgi:hypothetical protein